MKISLLSNVTKFSWSRKWDSLILRQIVKLIIVSLDIPVTSRSWRSDIEFIAKGLFLPLGVNFVSASVHNLDWKVVIK